MIHFIRLIRPANLLIIAATMYGTAWYFDSLLISAGVYPVIGGFPFFILVLSTVLIAAAGNIINDYFDVKADRINRPKRLIITKSIKRRWAILSHWIINFIAFGMAIYLSYIFETFWYLFIHLLSINLLWYYSMHFKRTVVFGNIIIALLTALVPLLVGIFYNQHTDWEMIKDVHPFELEEVKNYPLFVTISLGLFAFLLNWAREIIKDIEDIHGDKVLKAKTLPIIYGTKKAKLISLLILAFPVFLSLFIVIGRKKEIVVDDLAFIPLLIAAIAYIFSIFFILKSKTAGQYRRAHITIKIIMIFGLILPVYWAAKIYFSL